MIDEGISTTNNDEAGIFESYVIIGSTYFDLNDASMNSNFEGANLGSFSSGQSLLLNGGEIKTYKNGGANICGGKLWYAVRSIGSAAPLSFVSVNLDFIEDLPVLGDQKWALQTSDKTS